MTVLTQLGVKDEHERGRWVVVKNPLKRAWQWQVLLWGGNGDHPFDGASWNSWQPAMEAADHAAHTTPDLTPFLEPSED